MECCNQNCPQPRRGQNCGGCMPDTNCGMPPKTIMPCPSAPVRYDKRDVRMPDRTMTNRVMASPAPAVTLPDMAQAPDMMNPVPGWGVGTMPGSMGAFQPDSNGCWDSYPIGMAYVPWQRWQQPYPIEQGFRRGTIFPELDLPFVMGRCQ